MFVETILVYFDLILIIDTIGSLGEWGPETNISPSMVNNHGKGIESLRTNSSTTRMGMSVG